MIKRDARVDKGPNSSLRILCEANHEYTSMVRTKRRSTATVWRGLNGKARMDDVWDKCIHFKREWHVAESSSRTRSTRLEKQCIGTARWSLSEPDIGKWPLLMHAGHALDRLTLGVAGTCMITVSPLCSRMH